MSIIPMNPLLENGFSYLLASDFDQTLSFNDSCLPVGRGDELVDLAKANLFR
jgi:hypothetical protein